MAAKESSDWIARVPSWTSNHFTIANTNGNVPLLLRRVAKAVAQLGEVEVLDLTFCAESDSDACRVTVYFSYLNEPPT